MRNEIDKVLIVGGEKDFHDIIQNSLFVYQLQNDHVQHHAGIVLYTVVCNYC